MCDLCDWDRPDPELVELANKKEEPMKLKIKKITIVSERSGTDWLYLSTDLPPSIWPHTTSPALKLEVTHGKGVEYAKTHFPKVKLEVISLKGT